MNKYRSGNSYLTPAERKRRDFLRTSGGAVTWGALAAMFAASLPRGVLAEDSAIGARCMTILYPNGPDIKFDFDYYRDHHLTMIMGLCQGSMTRFELRKAVIAENAPPPPFIAAINIWVADIEKFNICGQEHGKTMTDDVPNFTNAQPVIQNDDVWGMAGVPSSATKLGQRCLTIAYPNQEGSRFDADYYRDKHLTLIMRLYGTEAIARFELRKGISAQDGTSPPAYAGTVNIYIGNQAAFDKAGAAHGQTLRDDVANFSSVMPMAMPTDIYGIG